MIQEQGFEDYALYVGFRASEWVGDELYDDRWINGDGSYSLMKKFILYEYWELNWRGYDKETVNRQDIKHECGVVMYDKNEDSFFFYEAPQDIISETPDYAGRVGYICEYDQ